MELTNKEKFVLSFLCNVKSSYPSKIVVDVWEKYNINIEYGKVTKALEGLVEKGLVSDLTRPVIDYERSGPIKKGWYNITPLGEEQIEREKITASNIMLLWGNKK
ncbi:MAG: hypothetical protein AAF824_15410 [Bacteroidota bacterium]